MGPGGEKPQGLLRRALDFYLKDNPELHLEKPFVK